MERIIRGHGHHYEGVEDGKACLHKLDQNDYDILFLDLFLPRVDGTDLLVQLKEKSPVMSVIVCSSMDDNDIIGSLLKKGARAFLLKPIREAVITEVIDRISAGTMSQDLTPLG